MGFLGEPFKHDLFVSYSHGAFKGDHDPDLKLWSQKFAEDLRAELAGTTEFESLGVPRRERPVHENVDRGRADWASARAGHVPRCSSF